MIVETMTVKDAINFIRYFDSESVEYNNACRLVDDYNTLVTLIKEHFSGAVGRVNFKVLENYTSEEVNQMIDNYLQEEF